MESAAAELEYEDQPVEAEEGASPASSSDDEGQAEDSQEEPKTEDAAPAKEGEEPEKQSDAEPEPSQEEAQPPARKAGPIPFERHQKILENTRAKVRAAVEAEYNAKLEALKWAEGHSAEAVQEALRVVEYAETNPVEFFRSLQERLESMPQYRESIRPRQQEPEPKPEPKDDKPKPDILLEDGRLTYSSEQMERLLEWQGKRFEERVESRIRPSEEREREREVRERVTEQARRKYEQVTSWEGMNIDDNKRAVAEAIARGMTVEEAYIQLVVPTLRTPAKEVEKKTRQRVLSEIKHKSRATTENPANVPDTASMKGKSIREIIEATAEELGGFDDN